MSIQDDINALHNHETFARFMSTIYILREETISEMHEAPTEALQQLSGRIVTYDQILQMSGWDDLRIRHRESL